MVGLRESWCFCNGGGKSERMKAAIFSGKRSAMARIADAGAGFLIHRNLLLTTHANLPSVAASEAAEIRLHNAVSASLFPHRFFITSSVLDLTIVGLDAIDENAQQQQPHYLKTNSKLSLDLGSVVYLLGYTDKKELTVGEGKVVIATDNLIKLSTDGITWSPGSAGFDVHGNLAFMVCDPMKLATSPNTKSSSTSSSSSSWKKEHPMQFGIPIPIICDWLKQHWEGSLDELNKPKLPLMRLMSSGQKSEHSCSSFSMRQVFKSTEPEKEETVTSSETTSKLREHPAPSSSASVNTLEDRHESADQPAANHMQGIPTPEIFESPKLTSVPMRKKETTTIQLLDINFPPRISKSTLSPQPTEKAVPHIDEMELPLRRPPEALLQHTFSEGSNDTGHSGPAAVADIASTGSINLAQSEVQSSCSPVEIMDPYNDYSSEGETTMYSAETAESRNYPSPREGRFQHVGRSQSCVNYNRWGPVQKRPVARRTLPERKVYSQGMPSQRSNIYSPTVSSIMKRRNNREQPNRSRQSAGHSSPKWVA